jgi:hypothetical protein
MGSIHAVRMRRSGLSAMAAAARAAAFINPLVTVPGAISARWCPANGRP